MSTSPSPLTGVFGEQNNPVPPTFPPPYVPQVNTTPLSADQLAALSRPDNNPFDKVQHEAKMNLWLMSQTEQANAARIQRYMLRYNDWKTNAALYLSCRPPIQPPPMPTCEPLEDVKPMPAGYWFGSH